MQPDPRFLPPGLGASLSRAIAHDLTETGISEVAMTVFGDPDVVPLWFGEGDLVTPGFVRDAVYLIRPDGYVGFADRGANAANLQQYLTDHQLRRRSS